MIKNNQWLTLLVFAISGSLGVASAQMTVANGASFDSTQPMAPGSFATVFGQSLCSQTATGDWIAPGQLPVSLGSCSVTVNGTQAMLLYVSPGQMNFIVPVNLAPGMGMVSVNDGSLSQSGSMMVGAAGPGVFALNGMGIGEGAILNAATWQTGPFSTMTNGQPTYIAMYVTGLDLSTKPVVNIGGTPVDVMWYGNAPDYVGLQQINLMLPSSMAGAGRVPVTVTSNGQVSNVTFIHLLPTSAMMQGMPGWGQGMMVGENMARGHEMSYLAFNAANGSVLVTDENDDVVRVISLVSNSTAATITLPSGSQAHAIAVNQPGTMAAVVLSAKASVALIDLSVNKVMAVVGTGYYPSRLAFSGSNLLVTNAASGTVSVIDTGSRTVAQTITTGLGASGIGVSGNTAVVANMQAGSISIIDLTTYAVSNVLLPAGTRPHEVALSASANKAVVTAPMSNGFLILDTAARTFTQVATSTWNGMGPGSVVVNGNTAYIANQMTASVTVADLAAAAVVKTFSVDPGPMALAVDTGKNRLLVLAEGTGTLDVVDLASYGIVTRINAGDTEREGRFIMPLISSISPSSASVGSTVALTITGSGFQGIQGIEFILGGGGMGGGMMGGGRGQSDANIKVSNIQVNPAGTQIAATVQILPSAALGARQIRLQTSYGTIMGMMTGSPFNVTK